MTFSTSARKRDLLEVDGQGVPVREDTCFIHCSVLRRRGGGPHMA